MAKENRKHKDTVFSDLFYTDESSKKNLLQLYNALYDEDLIEEDLIHLIRLENTLFMNFRNDVAFSVGIRRIILSEQQSTINENMPLRSLLYIARELESYLPTEVRYRKKIVKIPTPAFYVFYNGEEEYPVEKIIRLSDAYEILAQEYMLDLSVKVININWNKHHEILSKCDVLAQYSQFIERVRICKDSGHPLEDAVNRCIQEGVLAEYLKRRGSEVINMLIAEYDYDTDIRVQREESKEEGREEGRKEGRKEGRASMLQSIKSLVRDNVLTLQEASNRFDLTEKEIEQIS